MKVKVDTSEGVNRLGLLEEAYQKLSKAYNSAKLYTEKQDAWDNMGIVREEIEKRREVLGKEGLTLQQLKRLQAEYAQQWTKTYVEGSDQWAIARKNYDDISERIREITKNTKGLNAQNEALMQGLLSNVEQLGAESLTLDELEKLSSHLYKTIKEGSKASQENLHPLYQTYLNLQTTLKQSKDNMNALKVAENAYQQELRETVKEMGFEALSLNKLKDYYKLLQEEIRDTTNLENEHGQALIRNSQQVAAHIEHTEQRIAGKESLMSQIFGQIPAAFAGGVGGGVAAVTLDTIGQLPGVISGAVHSAGELADVNSDLSIALGKTNEQVQSLNSNLSDIDTRSQTEQLKELALTAGDLNEVNVEKFVEGMDRAYIAFKRDFSSAEDLADTFGRIKDLFPEGRKSSMIDFIDGIGSAIKTLNDDGPATTKGILEFMERMGQMPDVLKFTQAETAAYAAVLQEASMTAEVSAGGLSNILLVASQNAKEFAKHLHMNTEEFRRFMANDPNGFIQKLAMSFRGASGPELGEKLAKLKINSQESIKVIGTLADNIWKLKDKQELANKAKEEAIRLQQVFNEKNENDQAAIEKATKKWNALFATMSRGLTSVFMPFIRAFAQVSEKTKSLTDQYTENEKKAGDLQGKLEKLIEKQDALQSGVGNSAIAYRELQAAMKDIVKVVPEAATEYDKMGRIVRFNLGIVQDFIDKQKEASKLLKTQMEDEAMKKVEELTAESEIYKERLLKLTTSGNKKFQDLHADEINNLSAKLDKLRSRIHSEKLKIRDLNTEVENVEPPKKEEDTVYVPPLKGDPKDKEKALRERKKREKDEQDDLQKSIEIQAKMRYEADRSRATEENKRVLEAERHAEENLTKVRQQFTDEYGIVIERSKLTIAQKNRIAQEERAIEIAIKNDVLAIRKEFAEERANQLKEQITRTHELANQLRSTELQAELSTAQRTGDTEGAYLKQRELLLHNNLMSLQAIEVRYNAEKEKLKANKEALKVLENNFAQEKINLEKATNAQLDQLDAQHFENSKRRASNADIERQKLKISKLEQDGKNPLSAKLALLNSEMQVELQTVGTTEQEKANIRERYRQQEQDLVRQHNLQLGQNIIAAYSQAFNSIASFFQTDLNNRQQSENAQYQADIDKLEKKKEAKIINDKEYAKQKKILDDKHKEEERAFRKEQFEITRAENLSRATMELANSIIRASPDPLMITFAGIVGAAQIANILSAEPPAYEKGGFTDESKGMKDGKAGFLARVGEKGKEFIVPNWQLRDPVVANMVDFINHRRTNGIAGSTTEGPASMAIGQQSSPQSADVYPAIMQVLSEVNETMKQLPQKVSEAQLKLYFNNEDAHEVSKKIQENVQTKTAALR